MDTNTHKSLVELCRKLGSPLAQAERMATQLLKRSEQLAAERSITQVEALDHLLRLMISGRNGTEPGDSAQEAGADGARK